MIVTKPEHQQEYQIGSKAEGLFRLKEWGYHVPDFFCLPYSSLKDMDLSGKNAASLPEDDRDQMLDLLSQWNWKEEGVAVRSSFSLEDGSRHGFAGLFETVLDVRSEVDLLEAIHTVVHSSEAGRVKTYLQKNDISKPLLPAVIIQEQIQADFSGVLFSQYPEYPEETALHVVEGMGDQLVAGALSPAEFYFNRDKASIVHREVPDEFKALESRLEGGTLLQRLFDTAMDLESKVKAPADIEFCVREDQLFLLQVRPISARIPDVVLYDNSNIQESYCGVTTPLTFSFAQRAYATVYTQTMKVLGLPKKIIEEHEEVVQNLLGLVKGRIYYNIHNWYQGLMLLPSFDQNKEDMERMMGLEDPVEFVDPKPKSFWEKLGIAPRLLLNLLRLMIAFAKLNASVKKFRQKFQEHFSSFYERDLQSLDLGRLWELKKDLDEQLLQNWTTPIINDFYVMMKHGSALRSMKGPDAEKQLKQKTLGQAELASLLPAVEMQTLASDVEQEEMLLNFIQNTPSAEIVEKIKDEFPGFHKRAQTYIHTYGDRTVGELKLETKTMRTHPQTFYDYLKNLLGSEKALQFNTTPPKAASRKVRNLQKGIRNREALRLDRTRLFGMYRSLFLQMGERIQSKGILQDKRDIFFITEDEIESLAKGVEISIDFIEKRKEKKKAWEKEQVPSRVRVPSREFHQTPVITAKDQLKGQSCHPGMVVGEALVVKNPEDDLSVKGKIVCALRTDPGWATLFPSCKAVLIEKGSTLSHSAIILREMEIPTIINIPELTEQIKTGDILEVDAHTGLIKIVRDG